MAYVLKENAWLNEEENREDGIDKNRMSLTLKLTSWCNQQISDLQDTSFKVFYHYTMSRYESYTNMVDMGLFRFVRLPDPRPSKVVGLSYINYGADVLALGSDAVHRVWKWERTVRNPSGKSSASVMPRMWMPPRGAQLTNYSTGDKPGEESVTRGCIALSNNGAYMISASGGAINLCNILRFKTMATFLTPPPAATNIALLPQNNNIIAIGMEDSTILIYDAPACKIKRTLRGHEKQITGIAFSRILNVMVSAGADAQLCVWNIDGWVKRKAMPIQAPPGHQSPLVGETRIQFDNDGTHLLVVHESQISVYNSQLECLRSWYPRGPLLASITSASYSCDGRLVFTGFRDAAIGVFDADSFRLRCRIGPAAYFSHSISRSLPFPVVITANPSKSNQIALGMSNGSVHIIEPSNADSKWGHDVLGSAMPQYQYNPQSTAPAA